jgi:AraC family transcriptional regulator of adaptative response/methylated-DNA-[protein]-cysteine methyltransferase
MGAPDSSCKHLYYHLFRAELGLMLLGLEDAEVCFLHFGRSERCLLYALQERFPQALLTVTSQRHAPLITELRSIIHSALTGKPSTKLPSLLLKGTSFQREVWKHLQTIPPGKVRSYSDIAHGIGHPKAVRAVASACASNTIALLVPCHRAVRKDGSLGGYRWGTNRKASLLEVEKRGVTNVLAPTTTASA